MKARDLRLRDVIDHPDTRGWEVVATFATPIVPGHLGFITRCIEGGLMGREFLLPDADVALHGDGL